MVHHYGPDCFHTDKAEMWEFMNRFTKFRETVFEMMANTRRGMIPIPFNEVSAEAVGDLTPEQICELMFVDYGEKHRGVPRAQIPKFITGRVLQRRVERDCRYHLGPLARRVGGGIYQDVRKHERDSSASELRGRGVAQGCGGPRRLHRLDTRLFSPLAGRFGIPVRSLGC